MISPAVFNKYPYKQYHCDDINTKQKPNECHIYFLLLLEKFMQTKPATAISNTDNEPKMNNA